MKDWQRFPGVLCQKGILRNKTDSEQSPEQPNEDYGKGTNEEHRQFEGLFLYKLTNHSCPCRAVLYCYYQCFLQTNIAAPKIARKQPKYFHPRPGSAFIESVLIAMDSRGRVSHGKIAPS